MPVRSNGYYNNPEFAQAASNLSSLFAAPSGTDANGWAEANAKNAQASRLATLFSLGKTPSEQAALVGVQNYGATPQGFNYKVDTDDATTRRGQDVTANTSVTNNQADNVRALTQTQLQQEGDTTRTMLTPVAKDATRFVPPKLADLYGTSPTQIGVISAQPGETNTLPDGRVIAGTPKPLTLDEVKAAAFGTLPLPQQQDTILGAQTPVQTPVVNPDGTTGSKYLSPGEAVRTGAPAYNASQANDALEEGTALVNGKATQVYRKKGSKVYTTADNIPIDPTIQVFEKARPTGTSEQIGMKPTESSDKAGMFYNRAAPASDNMNLSLNKGYVPSDVDYEFSLGAASGAPNAITNRAVSDEGRKFYGNAQNFMMAVLRPDTGAAFGKDEFQSYAKIFIPLPGDDAATIAQKAVARATALSALQGTSHGSAQAIAKILGDNGLPIPPEMQAVMARGGVAAGQTVGSNMQAPAPAVDGAVPATAPADNRLAPDTPVASAAPAKAAPTTNGFKEGQTARDPKTGHRLVFTGGQWTEAK